MAFLSKFGNVLKRRRASSSMLMAIRCMSSSKLFIGGGSSSGLSSGYLLCYVLANFMNDFAIWQGMEYGMNEDSLREAFRKYGEVVESKNKNTGRGGLGLLHSPLQRRPLVLSKIMESDEFRASSKLETVTFSEMKHGEIEALVEFMYCVDGSISLESLKKHVGQLHYS
ncbi:unnamed protein product [Brassica oleracea var. botrytis]|uniref:(rape) hypothetical protein n=1 Tax=Brassica napus TaxID=3708 RepID=A0A816K8P8_BRANA|nr:unnamed protein product [Brassica napus]